MSGHYLNNSPEKNQSCLEKELTLRNIIGPWYVKPATPANLIKEILSCFIICKEEGELWIGVLFSEGPI